MFDYGTDPVVHLLLPKSSMGREDQVEYLSRLLKSGNGVTGSCLPSSHSTSALIRSWPSSRTLEDRGRLSPRWAQTFNKKNNWNRCWCCRSLLTGRTVKVSFSSKYDNTGVIIKLKKLGVVHFRYNTTNDVCKPNCKESTKAERLVKYLELDQFCWKTLIVALVLWLRQKTLNPDMGYYIPRLSIFTFICCKIVVDLLSLEKIKIRLKRTRLGFNFFSSKLTLNLISWRF